MVCENYCVYLLISSSWNNPELQEELECITVSLCILIWKQHINEHLDVHFKIHFSLGCKCYRDSKLTNKSHVPILIRKLARDRTLCVFQPLWHLDVAKKLETVKRLWGKVLSATSWPQWLKQAMKFTSFILGGCCKHTKKE